MKHLIEEEQELRRTAMWILKQVKAFKTCERHEFDYAGYDEKLLDAYKLANSLITRGELSYKRADLTHAIKIAFSEIVAEECCYCTKIDSD
jgi:hypothetical protein